MRTPAFEPRPSPTRPVRSAAITNLGCKVNQSEMEAAARFLRERGVAIVDDHRPADLYVVNTCTVTAIADQKSRHAVRRARRTNPEARIVVTGCSVQVDPAPFVAADGDARLVDNDAKDRLLAELAALAGMPDAGGVLDRPLPSLSGVVRVDGAGTAPAVPIDGVAEPIDGAADDRSIAERTRAFIKVQDGCSFFCTYCIIPRARGAERSLPPEVVLADVRRALARGHREVVLTGINVGTYDGGRSEPGRRGSHVRSALTLAGLVRRILAETGVERIRLSSIEPQHVDDELLAAWAAGVPRTLPHLHLPLQSGDDGVLRRMGRRYDAGAYREVVRRARAALPDVAIHADVIVGFPSEDEPAWLRTLRFIADLDPAGLHVFRYSPRFGTPATRMAGQVDEPTRKRRATELLAIAAEARARFARRQLGDDLDVLFETRLADGRWIGHAPNNVLVVASSPDRRPLENVIARVRVSGVDPGAPQHALGRVVALEPSRGRARPDDAAGQDARRPLPVVALPASRQLGGIDAG
ncbi:MAG TPA: tRNA (N(6)-L-threonylcarbamoyladenosine(37)-C(2))-methylthiotransferase MtaB [Candidatus Limnocylindrales bacterium]